MPTPAERAWMEARRAELVSSLKPASAPAESLVARLARMFLRFPSARIESEAVVTAYASDLAQFPLWVVDEAITEVLAGKSGYAPSSPELQTICRRVLGRRQLELHNLSLVLNADVYHVPTQAERDAALAKFNDALCALGWRQRIV